MLICLWVCVGLRFGTKYLTINSLRLTSLPHTDCRFLFGFVFSFRNDAGVPPLNLSMLGEYKRPLSNASPRTDRSQGMGATVPVLSTMSLTDLGVDVGMLQKNGVPDQ
jgi:hypothetical protein